MLHLSPCLNVSFFLILSICRGITDGEFCIMSHYYVGVTFHFLMA